MQKYLLYILATISGIIVSITSIIVMTQSPYTGLHFKYQEQEWHISSIDPNSPASAHPELTGAEIMKIGGHPVGRYDLIQEFDDISSLQELSNYWNTHTSLGKQIQIGSPLPITLRGDKEEVTTITIIPTHFSLPLILSKLWVVLITGLTSILVGLIIIFKKRKELYAKLLFWTFLLAGTMQIAMGVIINSDIAIYTPFLQFIFIINAFENIFPTAFTLHFFAIFPRSANTQITKNKNVLISLYALTTIVFLVYLSREFNVIFPIFGAICVILALYVMIKNYLKLSPLEKTQIRWLYIGASLFITLALILWAIPSIITRTNISSESYFPLLSILLPISIVFAIIRYRLMDINTLFDNTIIYGITLGGLALADIAMVSTLIKTGVLNSTNTPIAIAVSVWVIAISYMWLRNAVQNIVRKILKREIYNANDISLKLSRELLLLHDTKESFVLMKDIISSTLHPKNSSAYMISNIGERIILWEEPNLPELPLTFEQIKELKEPSLLYLLTEEPEQLPENYTAGIIVPIIGTVGMIGYFIFQDKHSLNLYDREDMKLFSVLSNQLAMSIEAISAREETKRKEMEAIQEKERISREIHDGIGSRFVEASMLSDQIVREADKADKIAKYGKNMKNILLDGLSDLRELIWAVEPGPSNLNAVISHVNDKIKNLSERDGFKVSSDIHIENEEVSIPAIMKLNLIRIIQETFTNTIKHAKATLVDVNIRQQGDVFSIRVTDNGIGFDATKLGSAGHGVRNIKKRCDDIGALLNIESEPGKGTTITISLILKPEQAIQRI